MKVPQKLRGAFPIYLSAQLPLASVLQKLNFQAVIKSVASEASRKTIQESRGAKLSPTVCMPRHCPWASLDSWFLEAALAADLITVLKV